jgi:hypothetical protein
VEKQAKQLVASIYRLSTMVGVDVDVDVVQNDTHYYYHALIQARIKKFHTTYRDPM